MSTRVTELSFCRGSSSTRVQTIILLCLSHLEWCSIISSSKMTQLIHMTLWQNLVFWNQW